MERGCDSLKPKDVRLLRAKLLSVNDLFLLGMFVVTLIGICLFLRSDKVLPFCIEDF